MTNKIKSFSDLNKAAREDIWYRFEDHKHQCLVTDEWAIDEKFEGTNYDKLLKEVADYLSVTLH